jgi:signal transduction histidine kinase
MERLGRIVRMPAWVRALVLVAGIVALGLINEDAAHSWEQPIWLPIIDLAFGWLLVACGLISTAARPEQVAGVRLVMAGYLSFELGFWAGDDPAPRVLGFAFGTYNDLALLLLALSFPDRAPAWRPARWLLTVTAALYLLQSAVRLVATAPLLGDPAALVTGQSVLEQQAAMRVVAIIDVVRSTSVLACGIALAWRLLRPPPGRRTGVALVQAAGVVAAIAAAANAQFALTELGILRPISDDVVVPMAWVFNTVRVVVPLAILAGVLRTQFARTALLAAVRDVGPAPTSAALRQALATALNDPGLRLLVFDSTAGRYVEGAKQLTAAELDALATDGRVVAPVNVDGQRVAALVMSGPPLDDGLVAAGVSLTGLVVQNQRLASLVTDQLADVHASRARILEAADRERRRIERDLHDGLQQRMVALAIQLRAAEAGSGDQAAALDRGADEVLAILGDVRELARGIHPAILTEAGLGPAIKAAADRSSVPVELALELHRPHSAAVTAAAYYVTSEALANVAKHATACAAWVSLDDTDGTLRIRVEDDGVGGADPGGHGLRGLADRVAALDGTFSALPRPGGGTTVLADIPLA